MSEIGALLWESSLADQRIIAGDVNAWPAVTEIANILKTYSDTWTAAKTLGTATSRAANPDGVTHGAHRIDYVMLARWRSAIVFDRVTK